MFYPRHTLKERLTLETTLKVSDPSPLLPAAPSLPSIYTSVPPPQSTGLGLRERTQIHSDGVVFRDLRLTDILRHNTAIPSTNLVLLLLLFPFFSKALTFVRLPPVRPNLSWTESSLHVLFHQPSPSSRTDIVWAAHKKMHITASWEGVEEVVEVDEGCRSVAALLETVAAALPELDAETVCLEIGGCAADDEAVCGLCEGCVVTVSVLPAVRAAATLREEGRRVDQKGFCRAAGDGDVRVCRLYLEAGVGWNPGYLDSPIHRACMAENIELCKLLIDGGWPLDLRDSAECTPLHITARANSVALCKLLIDAGCALDMRNKEKCTPLHEAARAQSVEVCKLLINRGCAIGVRDYSHNTALHIAARAKSVEVCKVLTVGGCVLDVPNQRKCTPLHEAVEAKSLNVCKLLIDSGCALDVQDDEGATALHHAVDDNSFELCTLLIDSGSSLQLRNNCGDTPLHLAVDLNSVRLCKLLIDSGCATNVKNVTGETPLALASAAGFTEVCEVLTDHDAC